MKKLLLIALMLGIGGSLAVAAPLCTTVTNAQQFENLGNGGCQFGDKLFYGFTYAYTLTDSVGNPLPNPEPAASVQVQFSNLGSLIWQPVVSFIGNWDTINGEQGDVSILYSVTAAADAKMYNSSLTLSGYVSDVDPATQFSSYISGQESITAGVNSVNQSVLLDPPTSPSGYVFQQGSTSSGYAPTTQISIQKDIFINAGSNNHPPGGPPTGNEATLTRIDEGLIEQTSLPEPVSFLLFGSGLITMVMIMKRVGKLNPNSEGRQ